MRSSVEHAQHELLDVVLVELGLAGDRDQLAVDAHQRRAERRDQQVTAAPLPQRRQVPLDRCNGNSAETHKPFLRIEHTSRDLHHAARERWAGPEADPPTRTTA